MKALAGRRRYEAVFPLVVLGSLAAWLGMWCEVLRPARGKLAILLGEPSGGLLAHRR